MRTKEFGFSLALAGALSLGIALAPAGQAEEYKPKVVTKSLYEGPSTAAKGKTIIVKHFTLPPGFVGGRHYHPADVFVYVLDGEFTIETEKGSQKLRAGELYREIPGMVMRARNVSTTAPAKIVVFQVGETGKPMMIKAK